MTFKLSQRSLDRMKGVDERLVNVVKRAIELSEIDFVVTEGLRTKERQAELFKAGATRTMNSKHIVGKAVDLAALVGGSVRWDFGLYYKLAAAMIKAAKILNVDLTWGAVWDKSVLDIDDPEKAVVDYTLRRKAQNKSVFLDGPHWEIRD